MNSKHSVLAAVAIAALSLARVKEQGKVLIKQVGTPLPMHADAYQAQCAMK